VCDEVGGGGGGGGGGRVLNMDFQENTSNGRRDTAEKVLRSSNKVPFADDRSR